MDCSDAPHITQGYDKRDQINLMRYFDSRMLVARRKSALQKGR
jgi:hypothetical protein